MTSRVCTSAVFGIALAITTPARADEADVPAMPAHPVKAPELPTELMVETHGWLRVAYHPSVFEGVRRVLHEADSLRASLATTLGQNVLEKVEVRIARTPEEMAALSPAETPPPSGAKGVAYPALGLVVLSQRTESGAAVDLEEQMRHQLAHVALFDAAAGRALPRWLQEGFAVQASGEAPFRRAQTLGYATVRGTLMPFDRLESFPDTPNELRLASAESADFVRFLSRGDQGPRFSATIARVRSGSPLHVAAAEAYGRELRGLELAWRDDVGHRYVTIPLVASAVAGWTAAAAVIWIARRRKKRKAEALAIELPEEQPVAVVPAQRAASRLIVTDRGEGHVVYIIAGKGIPKVEHDGKRHTLH
ncbi:MAG: peptidase MA family metallohydrolase [Polyangiales bacterium]